MDTKIQNKSGLIKKKKKYIQYNISDKQKILNYLINKIPNDFYQNLVNDDIIYYNFIISVPLFFDRDYLMSKINDKYSGYKKYISLFLFEKLINIDRFQVDQLDQNNNLESLKNVLIENIDDIAILGNQCSGHNKNIVRLSKSIKKIKNINEMKAFVSDIYNRFNKFVDYTINSNKKHINKIAFNITTYNNFKLNENVLFFTNLVKNNVDIKTLNFVEKDSGLCGSTRFSYGQIEWLDFLQDKLNIKINHIKNSKKEYKIINSRMLADGFCVDKNIIFEYNGCYIHGCKKCFPDENGFNKKIKKTNKFLYDKTIKKKEYCISNNYNFIDIWECQWNKMKYSPNVLNEYIESIKNIL